MQPRPRSVSAAISAGSSSIAHSPNRLNRRFCISLTRRPWYRSGTGCAAAERPSATAAPPGRSAPWSCPIPRWPPARWRHQGARRGTAPSEAASRMVMPDPPAAGVSAAVPFAVARQVVVIAGDVIPMHHAAARIALFRLEIGADQVRSSSQILAGGSSGPAVQRTSFMLEPKTDEQGACHLRRAKIVKGALFGHGGFDQQLFFNFLCCASLRAARRFCNRRDAGNRVHPCRSGRRGRRW